MPITLYSQMDPRWKNMKLGTDSSTTIGKFGCLLTDIAMVVSNYGFSETPTSLNSKMLAAGGFQGALVIPAILPRALPGMLYSNFIQCDQSPAPMTEIDAALSAGKPVIVQVDYSPMAGLQSHWVILFAKQGSDYLIHDPYPYPSETNPVTLTKRFGFAGRPSQIIQAVLWLDYASPVPGQGEGGSSIPRPYKLNLLDQASFPVFANVDGLALRTQPLVADTTLIKREPLGTQLVVLEKDSSAQSKIGVVNEWLAVRDPDGDEGYCAAWYVISSQPQPGQPPETPPAQQPPVQGMVLQSTVDSLALRGGPQVGDNLVKWLPAHAQLLVQEDPALAQLKIGVQGRWIQVQDVQGSNGYVAAWFVILMPGQVGLGTTPGSGGTPPKPDPTTPLVVRSTEDQLAFRSQPVIADNTLICRVPLNTEFTLLNASDTSKIGVVGQWLPVSDINGNQGFVAAWYVTQRSAARPGNLSQN